MGIIHTPRTLAAIARGVLNRSPETKNVGFTPGKPSIYTGRAGIFDVDYLGHMNNAATLTHAELARWEMVTKSGALETMYRTQTNFMVASTAIRFRRQIRPIFQKFEVHSVVGGIDDEAFWLYQTFRYPEKGNDRIRTQVIVKAVAVQGRQVVKPSLIMENLGVPSEMISNMRRPRADADVTMEEMFMNFEELDQSFRAAAAVDDKAIENSDNSM